MEIKKSLWFLNLMRINFYLINPMSLIEDSKKEQRFHKRKQRKATVCKIERLFLSELYSIMTQAKGALFLSEMLPEIMIDSIFKQVKK